MKIYIISGLGADRKVFSKIHFPDHLQPVFLDWLIPLRNEKFDHYIRRMMESIDTTDPFCLLGYSFGGVLVQEIDRITPAEKVVVLGSMKSPRELAPSIKILRNVPFFSKIPKKFFEERAIRNFQNMKNLFEPNPKFWEYFVVRDTHYLKWSLQQIVQWQFEPNPKVIQVSAEKDLVFPIQYCKPDYVIKRANHFFPVTKYKEVNQILQEIFEQRK